jgi:two-component system alkaline phosphatase synthesis response regulator PhoP
MSHRILLCDDERHILRAAEFKFKRAGFEVISACDGEEAWQCIQQDAPDLVVTDCQMPRLDGVSLVKRIRAHDHLANLPIIMLTAKGYEISQDELCNQYGVVAMLAKPFSPRDLLQMVQRTLAAQAPIQAGP